MLSSAERDVLARLRRENRQLEVERDILAEATAWLALKGNRDVPRVFEFVNANANQANANVRTMCRVLQVSASGYYAWRHRPPSRRAIDNAVLTGRIRAVHAASDATCGMPCLRAKLIDQGVAVRRHARSAAHARGPHPRRQPAPRLIVITRRNIHRRRLRGWRHAAGG